MFKPVNPKVEFPKLEEEILAYWKKNKIFEKSITLRPEDKKWTFLDGPPFVTGMPHYGSLLSSLPKDLFGRYWTMKGYRVRRVWGWDGHGLPIENKVETKLEITRKKDIEDKIGVKKFIEECRGYIEQVSDEWEWYIDRIGRWVDFKNAYKTWDTPYMESVMWVFKQMYDKGYVYKGLRVSLYCPHCATPISNFEVAMDADNYKEIQDPFTTYKYALEGETNTYILAWSTTPWNKIVTSALAVNPKLTYVKVKQGNEYYILADTTLKMLKNEPYKIVEKFKGLDLVGKKFIPHYNYYKDRIESGKKAFEIIPGDFVTAEEGTGVVTIAPYGEEDMKAMKEHDIHVEMHLDEEGTVRNDVPLFGGIYYLKANKRVNEDLKKRGLLYKDNQYSHSVPLCWRCHTRLYYAPQNAWYINVQQLKPLMKKTNERIHWFPAHFKYGRFLKSLENAPDWNISRNRYWGSPIPVWECQGCGERFVPGSIKELEEASGEAISDLHKPEIDKISVICKKCEKITYRVSEVLDSWIEAGSASFAERHYPFSPSAGHSTLRDEPSGSDSKSSGQAEKLGDFFPPDFIAEYTGQIRAWFYVLHVIGAALYESEAFKNVAVTGVILGTDGRKMSKNFGNYPDPREMLQKYGGDALRLYLMGSPVMNGEDIIISEEQYRNQVRGLMLILWNVYNFFVTYANVDSWNPQTQSCPPAGGLKAQNVLDQWVLSLLQKLINQVTQSLDQYNTVEAINYIHNFVQDLSTWYIRRSRNRVGPSAEDVNDKNAFYETSFCVLKTVSEILAPIAPFLSEEMYRNLTQAESVHLENWPKENESLKNEELEKVMIYTRQAVEQALAKRKEEGLIVKQPLHSLEIISPVNFGDFGTISLIQDEVNVKNVIVTTGSEVRLQRLDTAITPQLKAEKEARSIVRQIQEERKKLGTKLDDKVDVVLKEWPKEFEEEIKKKALVNSLTQGDTFLVKRV